MQVVEGCEHVFNLAADMGGMGFIQSNHSVIMYNNTLVSFNVMEAARLGNVKRCAAGRRGPCAIGAPAVCPQRRVWTPPVGSC